ncbi:MAG TPA: SUF system Fe-S cluster assembly regulator [Noviherbaspirillum sp.]|nr:SUF system Fe-S cluster assembly regulator [Noviherbaspirillum sp.]
MLRLSKMADYGTVVMTTMISEPERSRSAAEIAAAIHVPVPTVSKILKILARGGLVVSLRGARGGYMLSRPAEQISLVDVIKVMDGPIGMTECSVTPGMCSQESGCVVRANWLRINTAVLGVLQEITLDQMIAPVARPVDTSPMKLRRAAKPVSA